ncbi:hypothetical protein PR048_015077 [Dryococelus australis]|uniref:MADF domain-containing protein n=1 Tax=Dryococelus australis TaxID=614101 RepID=A0ABQ9HG72_9NEOP|nr:hypothetical protein PR048_015077 [Dryococelus australis]
MPHLEPSPVGFLREHKEIWRASVDRFSACSSSARTRRAWSILWNLMDGDYYRKPRKQDAWREIAAKIGVADEECKKKMVSLLISQKGEI